MEIEPADEYHVLRFSGWSHEAAVDAVFWERSGGRSRGAEEAEQLELDSFWDVPLGGAAPRG